jgi:chromosome segregation ATPase
MYRSEKSVMHSASRVKSCLEGDLQELRERIQMLNEEKMFLEEQLQATEEEKFSLLSAINEKDIELEETQRGRMMAELERDDLKAIVDSLRQRTRRLEEDNDNLKCQVNFGSTLNFNEHSVTRSEPIRSEEEDNHHAEIEALKAEVEKYRSREEEMAWNMRDLEMQL